MKNEQPPEQPPESEGKAKPSKSALQTRAKWFDSPHHIRVRIAYRRGSRRRGMARPHRRTGVGKTPLHDAQVNSNPTGRAPQQPGTGLPSCHLDTSLCIRRYVQETHCSWLPLLQGLISGARHDTDAFIALHERSRMDQRLCAPFPGRGAAR